MGQAAGGAGVPGVLATNDAARRKWLLAWEGAPNKGEAGRLVLGEQGQATP